MRVQPFTWSPWHTSPLDHIGEDLATRDGEAVHIRRQFNGDFIVVVDGEERLRAGNVLPVCDMLDNLGVGKWTP